MGAVLGVAVVGALVSTQGDVGAESTPTEDSALPPPEPTSDQPPAGPPASHDPFQLHDIGGPEATWAYEDLTVEEQAVVDRGFETAKWAQGQRALAAAAREKYPAINAKRAQLLLGVQDLDGTGVVP